MKKIALLGIFAIAMAFVESTVVLYLRELYYPSNIILGPVISVASIPSTILAIEWVREACTLIMLFAVAFLVGRKFNEKFAYFLYSFAVWDIFYYIWLKIILNWPPSFLTWDVLFLIPVTWVAPVLAPIIASLTMAATAFLLLKYPKTNIKFKEWTLLAISAVLTYASFAWDYSLLILKKGFLVKFSQLAISIKLNPSLPKIISEYVPSSYHWELFILAEILTLIALFSFYQRAKKSR